MQASHGVTGGGGAGQPWGGRGLTCLPPSRETCHPPTLRAGTILAHSQWATGRPSSRASPRPSPSSCTVGPRRSDEPSSAPASPLPSTGAVAAAAPPHVQRRRLAARRRRRPAGAPPEQQLQRPQPLQPPPPPLLPVPVLLAMPRQTMAPLLLQQGRPAPYLSPRLRSRAWTRRCWSRCRGTASSSTRATGGCVGGGEGRVAGAVGLPRRRRGPQVGALEEAMSRLLACS